jgi:hypothetical protein
MNRQLLETLYENPVFVQLIEELRSKRPVIPMYDWSSNNIEALKAKSLMQQGYDQVMNIINPFGDTK